MAKKTQSKPMKEILTRLQEFEYIRMVVFDEDVIIKVNIQKCNKVYNFQLKHSMNIGSSRKLANCRLFDIISFERISIGEGYTIFATS